jgi:hypothetical protein
VRAGAPTVVRLESALHGVSSLRLGDLGRRAFGMSSTGRTDLFLGTKVRNRLRTGQTRVPRALTHRVLTPPPDTSGRPARTRSGRWSRSVVNLWKTLARQRPRGIGSPGCPRCGSWRRYARRGKRLTRG